jgi:hypothetical protein
VKQKTAQKGSSSGFEGVDWRARRASA